MIKIDLIFVMLLSCMSVHLKFSSSIFLLIFEGRNRKLQGLAAAILKLWEKSLIAKIAVKLGIPNTDNEQMAYELKASFRENVQIGDENTISKILLFQIRKTLLMNNLTE